MRNGISAKVDSDLLELIKTIQNKRMELGTDRYKKSLSEISFILFKLLEQDKNLIDKLLTMKSF